MRRIRVGSRGSPLALRQAEIVCHEIERSHSAVTTEIGVIRTSGDQPRPEPQFSGLSVKRMFVKEIEDSVWLPFPDARIRETPWFPRRQSEVPRRFRETAGSGPVR